MLRLQNTVLEMVATGESLAAIAARLCLEAERLAPAALCALLIVDAEGLIRPLAAPSLPAGYPAAVAGAPFDPDAVPSGTAAAPCAAMPAADVAADPRWTALRHLALPPGLSGCWSTPVRDRAGRIVAAFVLYLRDHRGPSAIEQEIVQACIHLCTIAIEHDAWRQDRERKAFADALTGLANRASFDAALARLGDGKRDDWGLLIVDLDNLKTVNDTFGHHAGDQLLATVAAGIAATAAPQEVFRLGGDEFAVIVRHSDDVGGLDALAERILAAIARPAECGGHLIVPRATIGGATAASGEGIPGQVRKHADFALYHAKEIGRGGFVRYWPGIGSRIARRLDAIRDVNRALDEDRIHAFYQPVFRLDTREVVGFEALCRMRVGDEFVAAQSFFEATTDVHVATALTERMLSTVARDARRWLDLGIPVDHVGINISSADFHGGKLGHQIETAFAAADVPLENIILEVTETVYMTRGDEMVRSAVQDFRSTGLRVALDDFGTGYASLTHLLDVPIDLIKIDKSFVDRMIRKDGRAIVRGLLQIARSLDLRVVAEGIESEQQVAQLLKMGCVLGQGYLFSPALPHEAVTALLLSRRKTEAAV